MEFDREGLRILDKGLTKLQEGFLMLPDYTAEFDEEAIEGVIMRVAGRMQDNYPYFHPLYAGQMLKPPHPVARIAYMLSLWINPNNHAMDGGRASSLMEKEVVADLAGLFDWSDFLGHLTGGGTMANLEALWVSGKVKSGEMVVASSQAHYTHQRVSDVLGLEFESVACDAKGRMDIQDLERILRGGGVGTVVATLGTTGMGAVDSLDQILELRERFGFRLHVDAAYGGYFTLVDNLTRSTQKAYAALPHVDSIVIDPHKHGLQPYGCGCILFRDPSVGRYYKHDSPYTYFTSSDLHLGEISLECSRAGASAVALWATHQLLPPVEGGDFARALSTSREAALSLHARIDEDPRFRTIVVPELDILVWAPTGVSASQISERTVAFFHKASESNLHLATFRYPSKLLETIWPGVNFDREYVTCLRSCLMKPEHLSWLDEIWLIMESEIGAIVGANV